jgi:hypothetical protein
MTLSGGRYVATLDTKADGISKAGKLQYYVVARDSNASQKASRLPVSGALALAVKVCANTGPKITLLQASPTSIVTDPLGVGCSGPTLSALTAQATDVDGVKGIKLFFKKPGATTYSSRSFTVAGDTWSSFINTAGSVDNIDEPGTISWYAVATDAKGATTKSAVSTITVTRCDSPATFAFGGLVSPYNGDCGFGSTMQRILISASDPDAATGELAITVAWVARTLRGLTAFQGTTAASWNGELYVAEFSVSGWPAGVYTLEYYATSKDPGGGTTRSSTIKGQQFKVVPCPEPSPTYYPDSIGLGRSGGPA